MGPKPRSATSGTFSLITPSISRAHQLFHFFGLRCGNLEEQFVVDLQHHARFQLALGELAVERDHRQLDQVGGRCPAAAY